MAIQPDNGAGPARPVTRLRQIDPRPDQLARLARYDAGVERDWRRYYLANGKPDPCPPTPDHP